MEGGLDTDKKYDWRVVLRIGTFIVLVLNLIFILITQRDSIMSWEDDFINTMIEITRGQIINLVITFFLIGVILTILFTVDFKKTNWYKRYQFKNHTIPDVINIMKNRIKPQLENKVLNPQHIRDMDEARFNVYVQKWKYDCHLEHGVKYWFKETGKFGNINTKKILKKYPNLEKRIDELMQLLDGYDALFGQLLMALEQYMDDFNKDKKGKDTLDWIDLESWIYKVFETDDSYKRYQKDYLIKWNKKIEIVDEDISDIIDKIGTKLKEGHSDKCIKKCNEFIKLKKKNWKK